jgi:hypothetical protein
LAHIPLSFSVGIDPDLFKRAGWKGRTLIAAASVAIPILAMTFFDQLFWSDYPRSFDGIRSLPDHYFWLSTGCPLLGFAALVTAILCRKAMRIYLGFIFASLGISLVASIKFLLPGS